MSESRTEAPRKGGIPDRRNSMGKCPEAELTLQCVLVGRCPGSWRGNSKREPGETGQLGLVKGLGLCLKNNGNLYYFK
jgi:hypothetical protein